MRQMIGLIKMSRPSILPGGVLAYALGGAMGYAWQGRFDWFRAALGLGITMTANLMAHYADEYADEDADAHSKRTAFSGGSGVLPAGEIPSGLALITAFALGSVSILIAIWATSTGALSREIIWIVGLGLLGGWTYSMPPLQLERRGLGEIANALLGAILMPLMGFTVQTGRPTLRAVIALLPVFSIVMVGLLGVHWQDRNSDEAVGKRTLAVILGPQTRWLHHLLAVSGYVGVIAMSGNVYPRPVYWAMLATTPLAIWLTATFPQERAAVLNPLFMVVFLIAATMGWLIV